MSTTSQVAERHDTLAAAFDEFRREPGFGTAAVSRGRQDALDRFRERGWPTTRDEEWRFTNIASIAARPFITAPVAHVDRATVEPFLIPDAGAIEIVLVNGRLLTPLAALPALPEGLRITGAEGDTPAAKSAVSRLSAHVGGMTSLADLNAAFFPELLTIDVAARATIGAPIHLVHVTTSAAVATVASPRVSITVGEQAQVAIVETFAGAGAGAALTNALTDITLGPAATVDHVKIQCEPASHDHLSHLVVTLGRSSTFTSRALTFGGRIARNDIVATLDGEGAEATLNGLYVGGADQLIDTHTTIDHARAHCPSHEVYKGILAGRARAVFNGKIIVRPQAQKTDAKQTNKALLLTDDAQVNTKPQLEIFADDVKCTHGAAIGQLDEDAMFYLQARGIAVPEARAMLIHAFAGQVLDGIANEAVRTRALALLDAKLGS